MGTKETKRDWALDSEKPTELDIAVEFLNDRPHLYRNGQIDRYAVGRIMIEWASKNPSTSDEALPIDDVNNWVLASDATAEEFLPLEAIEMPYQCRVICHWNGDFYESQETGEEVKITHWKFASEPPCC